LRALDQHYTQFLFGLPLTLTIEESVDDNTFPTNTRVSEETVSLIAVPQNPNAEVITRGAELPWARSSSGEEFHEEQCREGPPEVKPKSV